MASTTPQLILASTSRYRAALMRRCGYQFDIEPAHVDEKALPAEPPEQLCTRLSAEKCGVVADRHPHAIVVGSDQVGVCDGRVLTKPGSHEAAVDQLRFCTGKVAVFHTGLAVQWRARNEATVIEVPTYLQYRTLSQREIEAYVRLDNPVDCAGSFKIEEKGTLLFERVTSDDPTALIGLPMLSLHQMLSRFGVTPIN